MTKSNNSSQATWIALGQFCAYAIGIVSPMILCRYFDKCDYGTYKQVMFVYNTLLTIFTLGLPRAYSYFIPQVSLSESRDVVNKITRVFILLGCFFSAFLFFGSTLIADLLKNPDLDLALKIFAPTPLFLLPVSGLDCILVSYKKAQYVALYSILTKVFTLLCIVLPVIFWDGNYISAIIGFDIASLLSFLLAIYLRNAPLRNVEFKKSEISYKDIFSFSIPLLVASIWILLFNSANQFFVSRYYGNETFAEFATGFFEFPLIPIVVNSVAAVLMPLFSGLTLNNKENIKHLWSNALTKSFKITYPIIVYCVVFAPLVMMCFYGKQYECSGIYFLIRNFGALFTIIPFYPVILALGKTTQYSRIHMIKVLLIYPLEYIVVQFRMPAFMIGIVFVLCHIVGVFLQFRITSKALNISTKELIPIKSMLKVLVASATAVLLPFMVYNRFSDLNEFVLLIATLSIFVFSYYIICFVLHISYKDILYAYLSKGRMKSLNQFIP